MNTSKNLVYVLLGVSLLSASATNKKATCDSFTTCGGENPTNHGAGTECTGISTDSCNKETCCGPKRWTEQLPVNTSCSAGVCQKGKWAAYFGGKSTAECKAVCDSFRKLTPEPEGITEKVYRFRQNGQFQDVAGSPEGKKPDFQRDVTQINYRGTGGNWPGWNRRDHFYARWEANLEIKKAGSYKIWTVSDDGSRLSIKGTAGWREVVSNPGWHGMRWREGRIDLTAGKHEMWAEMFEGGGGAGMEVYYQGPDSTNRVLIPASAFPDKVKEKGFYFRQNGQFHDDLEAPVAAKVPTFERKVPNINYRSTGGYFDSAFQKINLRDHFYMRWEGYIEIKAAGLYHFATRSDDGSRMYLDGTSMVENPGWHGMRERHGRRTLTAGKHAFWAEMFEGGGGAGMEWKYHGPDTSNQWKIVPQDVLYASLNATGSKLMLDGAPLEGGEGICAAYSHKTGADPTQQDCVIYSECQTVGSQPESGVCDDKSFDWVGSESDFTTCQYASPPASQTPAPTPVTPAPTPAGQGPGGGLSL